MTFILGIWGAILLVAGLESKGAVTPRQEWKMGIGLFLIALAVIVYVWREHGD